MHDRRLHECVEIRREGWSLTLVVSNSGITINLELSGVTSINMSEVVSGVYQARTIRSFTAPPRTYIGQRKNDLRCRRRLNEVGASCETTKGLRNIPHYAGLGLVPDHENLVLSLLLGARVPGCSEGCAPLRSRRDEIFARAWQSRESVLAPLENNATFDGALFVPDVPFGSCASRRSCLKSGRSVLFWSAPSKNLCPAPPPT